MRKSLIKAAVVLAVALLFAPAAFAYYTATTTATLTFNASFSESIATGFPTPVVASQAITQTNSYTTSGTGSGQVDTPYAAQLTLVASTPQTIDLTNLKDPAGNTIAFARVREFIVQNTTTTAGYDVKVESGSSNGWSVLPSSSSPLLCRYGSIVYIGDKLSTGSGNGNVVGSTSKTVTLDPGSNGPIIINLWVIGGSAQ